MLRFFAYVYVHARMCVYFMCNMCNTCNTLSIYMKYKDKICYAIVTDKK